MSDKELVEILKKIELLEVKLNQVLEANKLYRDIIHSWYSDLERKIVDQAIRIDSSTEQLRESSFEHMKYIENLLGEHRIQQMMFVEHLLKDKS